MFAIGVNLSRLYNATTFELIMSFNVIDLSMCFVCKIRLASFSCLCLSLINVLNGISRHHLLSNKVRQNSCPLILDNNHSKFSVICVRFMYTSTFFSFFFNPTPFCLFKDISCFYSVHYFDVYYILRNFKANGQDVIQFLTITILELICF